MNETGLISDTDDEMFKAGLGNKAIYYALLRFLSEKLVSITRKHDEAIKRELTQGKRCFKKKLVGDCKIEEKWSEGSPS